MTNRRPIDEVIEVFGRCLIMKDPTPLYAVFGAVAANLLPGDPVWLGIIAPPSSAKTEILNSLSNLPNVVQVSSLSPASFLSVNRHPIGTPVLPHLTMLPRATPPRAELAAI